MKDDVVLCVFVCVRVYEYVVVTVELERERQEEQQDIKKSGRTMCMPDGNQSSHRPKRTSMKRKRKKETRIEGKMTIF